MRLCKHLANKYGVYNKYMSVEMEMDNRYPWNGWLHVYDLNGKLYLSTAVIGGMYDVICHAIECEEYTEEERGKSRYMFEYINREWEALVG